MHLRAPVRSLTHPGPGSVCEFGPHEAPFGTRAPDASDLFQFSREGPASADIQPTHRVLNHLTSSQPSGMYGSWKHAILRGEFLAHGPARALLTMERTVFPAATHIRFTTTKLMSSDGAWKASTSVLMASKMSAAVRCLTVRSSSSRRSGK